MALDTVMPHLVSADKNDETDDVFLVVGLIRAQRDRNRARGVLQNDVAGRRSLGGLGPTCAETSFDLIEDSRARLLGFFRRAHLRGIAGIGRGAVERAVLPTRQHQARTHVAALPRPAGDRGKSLLRHRQIDDPGEVKAVGGRLRACVLRRRKRRQARHYKSQQPCLCLVSANRSGYFFWKVFILFWISVLIFFLS